jgi:hypothetical protein
MGSGPSRIELKVITAARRGASRWVDLMCASMKGITAGTMASCTAPARSERQVPAAIETFHLSLSACSSCFVSRRQSTGTISGRAISTKCLDSVSGDFPSSCAFSSRQIHIQDSGE